MEDKYVKKLLDDIDSGADIKFAMKVWLICICIAVVLLGAVIILSALGIIPIK